MIQNHLNTPMKKASKELHTACPFCGGSDRFVITPEKNSAWCRRCNWHGDEIALVMALHNVGYKEACERLNVAPRTPATRTARPTRPTIAVSKPRAHSHDVTAWRASAQRLLDRAWEVLMDDMMSEGVASTWLAERGIVDYCATIGYIPRSYNATWGGLEVHIPSGILLAWYDHSDQHPYKMNVRRLNPAPNENKYHMLKGSENGLYNSRTLRFSDVAVLVEGELDALSVAQATHGKVSAVATGSATGGRLQKYIAMLATRRTVLVAFDNDDAGEQASAYWLSLLPNAKRLKPLMKDANDMLRAGIDIGAWIRSAL